MNSIYEYHGHFYNTRRDFPEVSEAESKRMKISYLEVVQSEITKKIEDLRIEAAREAKKGRRDSSLVCLAFANGHVPRLLALKRRLTALKSPKPDNLRPLIERAKERPLSDFMLRGRHKCPYHPTRGGLCVQVYGHDAHCFSCAKDFNAIDYVMLTENLSFIEAVKRIA